MTMLRIDNHGWCICAGCTRKLFKTNVASSLGRSDFTKILKAVGFEMKCPSCKRIIRIEKSDEEGL